MFLLDAGRNNDNRTERGRNNRLSGEDLQQCEAVARRVIAKQATTMLNTIETALASLPQQEGAPDFMRERRKLVTKQELARLRKGYLDYCVVILDAAIHDIPINYRNESVPAEVLTETNQRLLDQEIDYHRRRRNFFAEKGMQTAVQREKEVIAHKGEARDALDIVIDQQKGKRINKGDLITELNRLKVTLEKKAKTATTRYYHLSDRLDSLPVREYEAALVDSLQLMHRSWEAIFFLMIGNTPSTEINTHFDRLEELFSEKSPLIRRIRKTSVSPDSKNIPRRLMQTYVPHLHACYGDLMRAKTWIDRAHVLFRRKNLISDVYLYYLWSLVQGEQILTSFGTDVLRELSRFDDMMCGWNRFQQPRLKLMREKPYIFVYSEAAGKPGGGEMLVPRKDFLLRVIASRKGLSFADNNVIAETERIFKDIVIFLRYSQEGYWESLLNALYDKGLGYWDGIEFLLDKIYK